MAATSIFFNGRVISVPGAYSRVDVSGLAQVGLSAVGIVAVLGTAVGGTPASVMTSPDDFIRLTKPEQAAAVFRSGDLLEVAPMLFDPSKDPDVPGGAVQVVPMKVNPATQSLAQLSNAYGAVLDLTSNDYGAFTSQENVSVGNGTTKGKLVTIALEDTIETMDNIGGDVFFNLKYINSANGWATMTSEVEATGKVKASGTRAHLGLDSDMTPTAHDVSVTVVSASAGDIGQQITIYGLDASSNVQSEVLTLNGATPVIGTKVWKTACVWGALITSGTTAGAVTVSSTGYSTIFIVPFGTLTSKGLVLGQLMYVAGVVTLVSGGASTKRAVIVGLNAAGTPQLEKITLTGVVPVSGAAVWSLITAIVLGEVEAAQTITASAIVAETQPAVQSTIQKIADYYNSRYSSVLSGGFVFTLATSLTSFSPADLDVTTGAGGPVSCLSPLNPAYYADLWAVKNWINTGATLIHAEYHTGAKGSAPSNTTAAVFLAGGSEGSTIFSNWQAALNLLKLAHINSVVVLTSDPAVHAALGAHVAYMCGIGRDERDAFVGLQNVGMTDVPTKTEIKSQIINLNTRHIRACAQAIKRYNVAGELQEFQPMFQAAILAGMQAGASIGMPLTHKYANIVGLRQNASWNPMDDSEELIQGGLCFMETIDGVGRRVVRNITTYLVGNNIAFTEGSVNEAVNFAVYTFRTAMEIAVGKPGFAGTVNAAKGVAITELGLLKDENVITASQGLNLELIADVLETSVAIAPVLPINFVPIVVHLVNTPQVAA